MIETEQTIPERKDNPAHSSKIRNNSMNGFKNDMDDEKSLKGKGATEHSNKTPEMQPERFLGNANQQQRQNLQLNHTTQSRMRMTRLKPVYR
ncbi:hypothetical protein PSJ72_23780 [Escherichia coli]|nr:hypothetical protein [Escherichia coli]